MTNNEYREYFTSLKEFSNDEKFCRFITLLASRAANKRMSQMLKEGRASGDWSAFDLLLMDLEDLRSGAYEQGGLNGRK